MLRWQPFFLLPPIALYFFSVKSVLWFELPIQLIAFFVGVMVCHGELVKQRPHPSRLTEFYLWISLGGVIGGFFVSIVAPIVFTSYIEFPVLYLLVLSLRPPCLCPHAFVPRNLLLIRITMISLVVAVYLGWLSPFFNLLAILSVFAVLTWMLLRQGEKPWRLALICGLCAGGAFLVMSPQILFQSRSFFGSVKVLQKPDQKIRVLMHGSTVHGAQNDDPALEREALTYYHQSGPFGAIYKAVVAPPGERSVGIVGLGTGTQVVYGEKGDQFSFLEIDPLIEKIAKTDTLFTFLKNASCEWNIILGDARLSLTQGGSFEFDLLVLDAFSSDAIPIHLLTREAMVLYISSVASKGLLAFHISNRYLDLRPVVGALVQDAGWSAFVKYGKRNSDPPTFKISPSIWIVAAEDAESLQVFADDSDWTNLDQISSSPIWTDDYSNILPLIKWPILWGKAAREE
jgi:hypothetical protein